MPEIASSPSPGVNGWPEMHALPELGGSGSNTVHGVGKAPRAILSVLQLIGNTTPGQCGLLIWSSTGKKTTSQLKSHCTKHTGFERPLKRVKHLD